MKQLAMEDSVNRIATTTLLLVGLLTTACAAEVERKQARNATDEEADESPSADVVQAESSTENDTPVDDEEPCDATHKEDAEDDPDDLDLVARCNDNSDEEDVAELDDEEEQQQGLANGGGGLGDLLAGGGLGNLEGLVGGDIQKLIGGLQSNGNGSSAPREDD